MDQYKTCKQCRQIKSLQNYTKDKTRRDGYKELCKACRTIKQKEWALKNPNFAKSWFRKNPNYLTQWRIENFWYSVDQASRHRARKYGCKEFVITKKNYRHLFSQRCVICGLDENPTIDHIIPLSRGGQHSIGNLQLLCMSCNSRKHNKTMTEWKKSESRD